MDGLGSLNYIGSIDLDKRKVINNPDGSISTERSFSFSPDGNTEILIPQIVDGKLVSDDDAIGHFFRTGEHLGAFRNDEKGFSYDRLGEYSKDIHERQDAFYNKKKLR